MFDEVTRPARNKGCGAGYCPSCLRHRPEKIVIDMKAEVLVSVLSQEKEVKIRSDDSYRVVGGLGGIGCSVRC
ncbi:hypothetical protein CIB48_g9719 [Xylaria polymorpha]|nr:hypothetical protein CIB48_g9719 [Xylaria polymorpha]